MPKYFCPLPFSHMEVDPAGDIRPCCMYSDFVRNIDGEKANALTQGFAEVFNNEWYKELRRKMLNDETDPGCIKCYTEEANGIESRRIREIKRNAYYFDSTDGVLISLDIKLGNTCNLTCLICNPFSSSRVLEEQVSLGIIAKPPKTQYEQFKWYNHDEYWEQLLSYGLDNLRQIDIMGGEPMLAKKHFDFLKRLIESGHANHIDVNYVTNGTIVPPKTIQQMYKQFKSVYFTLSADATGSTFEYVRHPASWDSFITNLRNYKAQGHSMTVSYSVSAYSLFGIFDALDFYLEEGGVNVWFNIVYNEDRNIQLLPKELKREFENQFKVRYRDDWKKILPFSDVNSLINYMNQQDTFETHWDIFCKRTSKLDAHRGKNILDVIPEYRGYYENQI